MIIERLYLAISTNLNNKNLMTKTKKVTYLGNIIHKDKVNIIFQKKNSK